MTERQKQELAEIEEQILKTVNYNENSIIPFSLSNLTHREIERLEMLIGNRYVLLNDMFLCTTNEIERFKQVNERLQELTDKMHTKALKLYRSILKEGYDPDFDDDIMLEATHYAMYLMMNRILLFQMRLSPIYTTLVLPKY